MTVSSLSKIAADVIFSLVNNGAAAGSELEVLADMINQAQQALHQLPEIDEGRIAELKQAVASHQIALNADTLAGEMLAYHRN